MSPLLLPAPTRASETFCVESMLFTYGHKESRRADSNRFPAHYEYPSSVAEELRGVAKPAFLKGFPFSGLSCVAPYCIPGGVTAVSGAVDYTSLGRSSAVRSPTFPTFPLLRLIELLRMLLVASVLQSPGSRVDHERYGWLVGVVADAVPLALGDEHSIALAEAHWLPFREG